MRAAMRTALGEPAAQLGESQMTTVFTPMRAGFNGGVFRVEAEALVAGSPRPWSCLVKVMAPAGDNRDYDHPTGAAYWRREADAYACGCLANLPGGVRAPACYGVHDGDRTARVWLEEVADEYGQQWPLSRFDVAARHLGQFNGAYLVGAPMPSFPSLRKVPLAAYTDRSPSKLANVEQVEARDDPLWRSLFPTPIAPRLRALAADQPRLIDTLERLPQTFCHYDFADHNLFSLAGSGARETVAIDWESVGVGCVGQDAAVLGLLPFGGARIPPEHAPALVEAVFQSYLDGLRAAGWKGDPAIARFGFATDAALRWAFNAPPAAIILDPSIRSRDEGRTGKRFEELVVGRAAMTKVLLDLADEAISLLDR
ncbi:MAG TPA: phosphotransferase [Caulobacteraceae bacterium]